LDDVYIFASWSESEYVPSVRSYLCSRKLDEKALLLLYHCPTHPSADVPKSKNGKIKDNVSAKDITALIQYMDQDIIQACKVCYHGELLAHVVTHNCKL
jgi:hypothetical protein